MNKIFYLICFSLILFCRIPSLAKSDGGTKKIAFIGASITEGVGTDNPEKDAYPNQLSRMLGKGYVVSNFGVSGCTMIKKGNKPYTSQDEYRKVLNSNADIVIIDLGGNDSKSINRVYLDEFADDAVSIINDIKRMRSNPRIILMTPIVSFVTDTTYIYDKVISDRVISCTIKAAKATGVEVVDMHSLLLYSANHIPDGVHPDNFGSSLMAKKLYDYLSEFKSKPSNNMTIDGMSPNPFITHLYTADPSAHVWNDGRLYVYASHDIAPPRGCDLMDKYHVFSTDDMINWTDHGEILNSSQVPWGRKEGGFMWAPDCAYKDGTYYFYFPHPSETITDHSWKIGIATSKEPASGFKVIGYIKGVPSYIDPCIFIDDDGQAYVYNGGGGTCMGGKLKDNMVELDGEMKKMEGLVDFHEATWVHKYNGLYYLSYSDNYIHDGKQQNRLNYAVSSSPLGPWKYQGIYLQPTDCDTSHGSIVKYKGSWYALYHNCSLTGRGNLRSICVDKLFYNEDGTIKIVGQRR